MAFTDFARVDDVVKKYKLRYVQGLLMPPDPTAPQLSEYFREELVLCHS